jgi:hypothetical protein
VGSSHIMSIPGASGIHRQEKRLFLEEKEAGEDK